MKGRTVLALVKQHPQQLPAGYPAHLEELVTLVTGELLWVRPLVPGDAAALAAEFASADEETLYMRFFSPFFQLTPDRLRYLTDIDYHHHVALAAMVADGDHSQGVAIARFAARSDSDVEVAVVVKPEYRRRGIARMLFERLATIATDEGYRTMSANYLEENHGAAALLASCGFRGPILEDGMVVVQRQLVDESRR